MGENFVDPNSGAAPQPGGHPYPAVSQNDEPTDVGADTSSLTPDETPQGEQPAGAVQSQEVPAGNASRDVWVEYARGQGATAEELASVDDGGLSRDELRAKYNA